MADTEGSSSDLRMALNSLTVPDLQRELQKRHLKKSGKKEHLINRLLEAMEMAEKTKEIEKDAKDNQKENEEKSNEEAPNKETINEETINEEENTERILDPVQKVDEESSKEDEESTYNSKTQDTDVHEAEPMQTEDNNIIDPKADDKNSVVDEAQNMDNKLGENQMDKEVSIPKECAESSVVDTEDRSAVAGEESHTSEDISKQKDEIVELPEGSNVENVDSSDTAPMDASADISMEAPNEDKVQVEDYTALKGDSVTIPERKYSAPVPLKKRRESSLDSKDRSPRPQSAKKRRWGSSAEKSTVTISSESIKALIPDVRVSPSALDADVDFSEDEGEKEEGEIDESTEKEEKETPSDVNMDMPKDSDVGKGTLSDDSRDLPPDENKEEKSPEAKDESERKPIGKRIVRIGGNRKIFLKTSEEISQESDLTKSSEMTIQERKSLLPSASGEASEDERERSPVEPSNPVSVSIHIQNLVRPFTVRNLQEHISKTGSIVEGQFWIDKIKSHCYVTFTSEEEALATIKALDGVRWPHGSPKVLSVDYASNEQMYKETLGTMGALPMDEEIHSKEIEVSSPKEEEDNHKGVSLEQELKERKAKRKEEKAREKERKKKEQSPTKLVDDLFRKTKATPCIYWLPLTDAQVQHREQEREERLANRRKQRDDELAARERQRMERQSERQGKMENRDTSPKRVHTSTEKPSGHVRNSNSPRPLARKPYQDQSPPNSPQRRPHRVRSPVGGPLTRRS